MRAHIKLAEWFKVNRKHADGQQLRYFEFLQYFTWNNGKTFWTPRASMCVRQADSHFSSGGTQQKL